MTLKVEVRYSCFYKSQPKKKNKRKGKRKRKLKHEDRIANLQLQVKFSMILVKFLQGSGRQVYDVCDNEYSYIFQLL